MRSALGAILLGGRFLLAGSVLMALAGVAEADEIDRTGLQQLPWHAIGPASGTSGTQGADEGQSSPRMACEEAIYWAAAIQGYLKSKLHLTAVQKAAWQNFELAAEPALDRQRELCAQLPSDTMTSLELPERQELAKKMLAIRADYLRSTEQSRHVLADSLSSEQQAILSTPPFSTAEVLH